MTRRQIVFIGLIILALAVWGFFGYQIFRLVSRARLSTSPVVLTPPTPTPDPDQPFSVLLLGYGGGGHDGGSLTDSIVLAQFLPRLHRVSLLSIPRDLWVKTQDTSPADGYSKINYAYPLGGGALAKKVVADVTGITPDYYFAIDFTGFTQAVDLLGGINLRVTRPFTDNFYPIEANTNETCGKTPEEITALEATMSGDKLDQQFLCRYEKLVFNVGTTHLDGVTSLKYARSRHSETAGGDFNRGERQRQVMLAVRDRLMQLGVVTKIIPLYKTIIAHTSSDINFNTIEKYLFRLPNFSGYTVTSTALTDQNLLKIGSTPSGQSILMPREGIGEYAAIRSFIASASATN